MADNVSSSTCLEDVLKWLQSIVDHLEVTQAKCLSLLLRPVLESSEHSLKSVGVDIQPFLESLGNSAITELGLQTNDLKGNIQDFSKMLVKSKIETLRLNCNDLNVDDILSLTAVLKDTKITKFVMPGVRQLTNDQADILLAHLSNSHLTSLDISASDIFPFRKMSDFYRCLRYSQITSLNLSYVFPRYRNSLRKTNLFRLLMSNLKDTALTDLTLEGNIFDDSSAKAIGRVLGNSKLEKLDLRNNRITDTGVDFLCAGLIHSKVTHLNLSGNQIEGDNALGDSVKLTKIRKLDLSKNPISKGKMFSAHEFLQGSISILDLSCCFCRAGASVPSPILQLRFAELTCLKLSHNKLSFEQISALAGVLSQSSITHINLSGNEFSEECYIVLGECLGKTVLKYVDLGHTASSQESVRGIAFFIDNARGSGKVSVNLTDNKLDLVVIASSLANTTFLELDLSANPFTNGVVCLTQQLKLTAITSLSLNGCCIGDDGAATLANCLQETRVVLLKICANNLTSRGAKALAVALKKTKLRHVDLKWNKIEDDGLESLVEHAQDSCITSIDVFNNPGKRKPLVYRATWENRTKVQQFADLLKRTAFFTGDSNMFEFDRDFEGIDIEYFIEDLLKVYKTVYEKPYIVRTIEHDKCILDLNKQNCCELLESRYSMRLYNEIKFLIEDCEQIYKKILEHPSPVQSKVGQSSVCFFEKQTLWLVLDYFPTKFVSFIGEKMVGDLGEHVAFLRRIEELGLSAIVELLLLNRPVYTIDEEEDILHPFVYKLLFKYKQTICNTDIEPEGVDKITSYFQKHKYIEGASEVISLLNSSML